MDCRVERDDGRRERGCEIGRVRGELGGEGRGREQRGRRGREGGKPENTDNPLEQGENQQTQPT